MFFTEFREFTKPRVIRCGGSQKLLAVAEGAAHLQVKNELGNWIEIELNNALFVPGLRRNLISVAKLTGEGWTVVAKGSEMEIRQENVRVRTRERQGLYELRAYATRQTADCLNAVSGEAMADLQTFHEAVAHRDKAMVRKLLARLDIPFRDDQNECFPCLRAKKTRASYRRRPMGVTESVEHTVYTDLCGPIESSRGGSRYFMVLTEGASRFRRVYFLKQKSEVPELIQRYVTWYRNQRGRDIRTLHADNGTEFINQLVVNTLEQIGAQLVTSCPYTPQQNAVAERTNRFVTELARTSLLASGLPRYLWSESVNYAVQTLNFITMDDHTGKSAYEIFYQSKPNLKLLRKFGDTCFVLDRNANRHKFASKASPAHMVGYADGVDGYRLWFPQTRTLRTSRDVQFTRTSPFSGISQSKESPTPESDDGEESPVGGSSTPEPTAEREKTLSGLDELSLQPSPSFADEPATADSADDRPETRTEDRQDNEHKTDEKRKLRDRHKMKRPHRYEANLTGPECRKIENEDPTTYEEVLRSPERDLWLAAIRDELQTIERQAVWSVLVELPRGRRAISTRWVFTKKRAPNGEVTRHRARLVARGCAQRGIDFSEIYSPVARLETVRLILAISASQRFTLRQLDVKCAFFYGLVDEELYITLPAGVPGDAGKPARLHKALYGLRQAPLSFNRRLRSELEKMGYNQSLADPCLFYKLGRSTSKNQRYKVEAILAVYVDDAILATDSPATANRELTAIAGVFEIKAGPLEFFLGLHVNTAEDGTITINQKRYIADTLARFDMQNCRPAPTPSESVELQDEERPTEPSKYPFRELVGCLLWLTMGSRPDLAFSVGYLSRHLDRSTEVHWKQGLRVLRYLAGTAELSIRYTPTGGESPEVYSDADWAGCVKTRKSISSHIILVNGGAVSWASTQQKIVALSSAESEYTAATEAAKSAVWITKIYNEILYPITPKIYVDNQSAIRLCNSNAFHRRTKHFDVKSKFIKDLVEKKQIELAYIPTEEQRADIGTKSLTRVTFQKLRDLIGLSTSV